MEIDASASPDKAHDAPDVPQAVTDEELFEAYLSARLTQSLDTLNCARDELAAQPHDFKRALLVMRRVHELRDLQAQLDAQRGRVNAARNAAGIETQAEESPAVAAAPSPAFRAAQAEQAERVMAALAAQPRTCPSCQALLEASHGQCGCGYTVEVDATNASRDATAQNLSPFSTP